MRVTSVLGSRDTESNSTYANVMQLFRGNLLSYFISTEAKGNPELMQRRSVGFLLFASRSSG